MEINNKTRLEQPTIQQLNHDSDSPSDPDTPPLEMTVVLNETNPYWGNDVALRCASNSELTSLGGKVRRDFKFQVIQVRSGPKWFVFPSNKSENNNDLSQSPVLNNSSLDQENQRDTSSVRRSMRFMNRRKVSNDLKSKNSNYAPFDDELCKVTATNQSPVAPMSEPTTRRINTKAIFQPNMPVECRFQVTKASLSVSPPSTSSNCSTFSSNQSTLSSCNSNTFEILSIAKKWDTQEEGNNCDIEENEESDQNAQNDQTNGMQVDKSNCPNSLMDSKPIILINSSDCENA